MELPALNGLSFAHTFGRLEALAIRFGSRLVASANTPASMAETLSVTRANIGERRLKGSSSCGEKRTTQRYTVE